MLSDGSGNLQSYVRLASKALDRQAVTLPPISEITVERRAPIAQEAVRLAAERYGLALPKVRVTFGSLYGSDAGRITRQGEAWLVDVSKDLLGSHSRVASVIAHELAHLLLEVRAVGLADVEQNERLTDATAVLAGFGPLMAGAQTRRTLEIDGPGFRIRTHRVGYLSGREIRYLHALRERIAHGTPLVRWAPYFPARDSSVPCPACATPLRLPAVHSTVLITCPICHLKQRVRLQPLPEGGLPGRIAFGAWRIVLVLCDSFRGL